MKKHGGPRKNSGRPLKGTEKMTQRTITMEPSTWAKLDQLLDLRSKVSGKITRGQYFAEVIVADWYLAELNNLKAEISA